MRVKGITSETGKETRRDRQASARQAARQCHLEQGTSAQRYVSMLD